MVNNGMFPHFLGVLSKTPVQSKMQMNNNLDIPHPFSKSMPPIRRHQMPNSSPMNGPMGSPRPPLTGGYGGKIFQE